MHFPSHESPCEFSLTSAPAGLVLDTNVVLDWLLFADPAVAALTEVLASGRVRWLATTSMRGELSAVLERGLAAAHGADADAIVRQWDALVHLQMPAPVHALRCSDADDQKFFDLAIATAARWLMTRDRALLKLARRAAPLGLSIVTPAQWQWSTRPDPP
jgi:predicted nucleic acid-binding protein